MGRTGMSGRGLLGRFGPNHAADPIVTRYLRLEDWCFAVNLGVRTCDSRLSWTLSGLK